MSTRRQPARADTLQTTGTHNCILRVTSISHILDAGIGDNSIERVTAFIDCLNASTINRCVDS
ncbi:hypothetical protein LTSEINV_6415 [Salmonella enterica subsp. enterica serovar Inverness str. R8-3668]|uniref:Uncharacterized protein n=1 Tax=Salmonella enterica subsp. enterica serovar Inverness str. R8-3668 TaxID=913075 RepID=G5NMN5_SALET|nr:hypothetical protein LTSEINV_6415 [Salmonella enterica subsp. enterica serovar Inverness str. R8-3668]